jgi:hypothetical protein
VMPMGEQALRVLFKRRWNEISGLTQGAFMLSLDEQRAFYEFLLRYPPRRADRAEGAEGPGFDSGYLLRKIDEIAALDASYPRLFARGVVQFRSGDFRHASRSFSAHLDVSPDGPWALRAQNHLRAALERANVEPF